MALRRRVIRKVKRRVRRFKRRRLSGRGGVKKAFKRKLGMAAE